MRSPFAAAPESELRMVVERGWGIEIRHMHAVLEGAGAHHWNVSASDGRRWFVTCDDLATKPWLGADHDTVFVIEQNRDAQLRMMLINEQEIDPARLEPILHYDGTPITARFIIAAILQRMRAANVEPIAARQGKAA